MSCDAEILTTKTQRKGNSMEHQGRLTEGLMRKYFPFSKTVKEIRPNQDQMIKAIAEHGCVVLEAPTGSGKTETEMAMLRAAQAIGLGPLFLIAPSKTIVQQIAVRFPEVAVALGRNEHPCYFYEEDKKSLPKAETQFKADQVPCSLLDCPHRVNQETGETQEPGYAPCPYYLQKYQAKQGDKIVVCTISFYLFSVFFGQEFGETDGVLAIDEVHRIADVIRNTLSSEISDFHIRRSIEVLERVGAEDEAKKLSRFLGKMITFIKRRPPCRRSLLKDQEINELLELLESIDQKSLKQSLKLAMKESKLDPKVEREVLKKIETLVRDLRRYVQSFTFSLATEERKALNYIYAYYTNENPEDEGKKVQFKLVVKCHYVAPLIKRMLQSMTVGFSATIGQKEPFRFETGIKFPLVSLPSDFPVENTAIFMPTDTPNLAVKYREKREPTKVLRRVAKACVSFKKKGHRSLVVVISNDEREKFTRVAVEEGLDVVTYGDGFSAKDAALAFRDGMGDTLLGTAANYAEGVDLPKQIAPIIFFLRPGYPSPDDPGVQFEERRFGAGPSWSVRTHRVINQALQTRGRNIRSEGDVGVTFFISQQFRNFLRGSLPEWLQKAYEGQSDFDACCRRAREILK